MKASASTRMTAGGVYDAISTTTGLKKKDVKSVVVSIGEIATAEVQKNGKFVVPGIASLKLKSRPARTATTRMMFGQMQKVAAKPASKVVKAFATKSLKDACM